MAIKILFNGCRGLKLYLKCPLDENVKLSALISKRGSGAFPEEIIPPPHISPHKGSNKPKLNRVKIVETFWLKILLIH